MSVSTGRQWQRNAPAAAFEACHVDSASCRMQCRWLKAPPTNPCPTPHPIHISGCLVLASRASVPWPLKNWLTAAACLALA